MIDLIKLAGGDLSGLTVEQVADGHLALQDRFRGLNNPAGSGPAA